MKTIAIILILSLINIGFGCYSDVLVKPSTSFYGEELENYPKIAVFTKDKTIYEFNQQQYKIENDSLYGLGSEVISDTFYAKLGGYKRDNLIPAHVELSLSDIENIEYEKLKKTETIIGIAALSIVVLVPLYLLVKECKSSITLGPNSF